MALSSVGLFIPANDLNQITRIVKTTNEVPVAVAIWQAMGTAALANLSTCTVDVGGYSEVWVRDVMNILEGLGYQISYSGHTVTIKW